MFTVDSEFHNDNFERDEEGNFVMDDMIFDEEQVRFYFGDGNHTEEDRQAFPQK